VWHTVPKFPYRDCVEWHLRLSGTDAGTAVSESFDVLKIDKAMEWLIAVFMPAHRDRTGDLRGDLDRLRVLVESKTQGQSEEHSSTA
jgi:hypothetical protein